MSQCDYRVIRMHVSEPLTENIPKPEFIRLPRSGHKCSITGLSRSALNSLILPSEQNAHSPPVRSHVIKRPGAKTGIRLIEYQSLIEYIRNH